jgi:hypothetical protein
VALLVLLCPAAAGARVLPPVKIAAPVLSGSPRVGETLTCAPGSWSGTGIAFTYRWLLDGAALPGATDPAYGIAATDLGHRLGCEVTATNAGGARTATVTVTVLVGQPVSTAAPAIRGTVQTGETLTCDPGAWTNVPTGWSTRWLRDGAPVATGGSLALSDADQGHQLS